MQPIIHKASLRLIDDTLPKQVTLGDAVNLLLQQDGQILAIWMAPSRLPFGFGKPRERVLGCLGKEASDLLRPALVAAAHLRVRIVEIEPAHLGQDGVTSAFVSVWGDPSDVISKRPKNKTIPNSRFYNLTAQANRDH
jgi:hypothetical protein